VQRPKSTPIWAVGPACPVQPLSRERQPGPPNAYQLPGRTSKAHQAVTGSETTRARPARPVFPTAPHFEPVTHSATLYVLDSIIPMPPTESPLRSEHPYAEPGKTTRRALPLPLPLFIDRSSGRRSQSGRRGKEPSTTNLPAPASQWWVASDEGGRLTLMRHLTRVACVVYGSLSRANKVEGEARQTDRETCACVLERPPFSTKPVSPSMLMAAATPAVHYRVVQLATWHALPTLTDTGVDLTG
jgi:hypothetical protein